MTTAMYDVTLKRSKWVKTQKLAVVRAVHSPGPAGNWFDGVSDIMTPDRDAIFHALPHGLRAAWSRVNGMWHTSESLHASATLYGSRGKVLATVSCDGYEM